MHSPQQAVALVRHAQQVGAVMALPAPAFRAALPGQAQGARPRAITAVLHPLQYRNMGAFAAPAAAAPAAHAVSFPVVHVAHAPAAAPHVAVAPNPAPAAAHAQPFPDPNAQTASTQQGWMPAVGTALTVTVVLPALVVLHLPVGCWAAGVVGAAMCTRVLGGWR